MGVVALAASAAGARNRTPHQRSAEIKAAFDWLVPPEATGETLKATVLPLVA